MRRRYPPHQRAAATVAAPSPAAGGGGGVSTSPPPPPASGSATAALFLHPWRFCPDSPQEAEADLLALMDSHGDAAAVAGLGADTLAPAQQDRLRAAFGWSNPGVVAVFSVRTCPPCQPDVVDVHVSCALLGLDGAGHPSIHPCIDQLHQLTDRLPTYSTHSPRHPFRLLPPAPPRRRPAAATWHTATCRPTAPPPLPSAVAAQQAPAASDPWSAAAPCGGRPWW